MRCMLSGLGVVGGAVMVPGILLRLVSWREGATRKEMVVVWGWAR